jgi:hypothetical protein
LSASPHEHSPQSLPDSLFEQEMMESMRKMDQDMGAAPMSGNPNHDFSAMMIPHHQGAIDMAKTFLLHGQDAALRRLAQEIIVTQQQEIQVMQLRLATLPTGGGSAPTEKKQDAAAPLPVSEKDRVYTGDQTSNTVSVINPASNKLLGVIRSAIQFQVRSVRFTAGNCSFTASVSRRTIAPLRWSRSVPTR